MTELRSVALRQAPSVAGSELRTEHNECALCICALKQQSKAACPVLSRTSALIYFAHLHFYNKVKFTLETCVLCICSLEQQSEAAYIVLSCKSALFKGKHF